MADVDSYIKKESKIKHNQCFSIVFRNKDFKQLNFVAPNKETCDMAVQLLSKISSGIKNLTVGQKQELWLSKNFDDFDQNKDETLNRDELVKLTRKLGLDHKTANDFSKKSLR